MNNDVRVAEPVEKGHGPYSSSNRSGTKSGELINTYYLYSFDGKLMEEYDHNGNCVKQYIYFGNRLLAEYQPQTNKYYYYMTDQINSTRIVTDDSGNVVYSEAYGPYGDVQKTWNNTYNPKPKFSGKERETYSDLDYFGARYYDNNSYRFMSVDPVITKEEAFFNPQLWNLYSYCRNNPVTFLDPDGRVNECSGYFEGLPNYIMYRDSAHIDRQIKYRPIYMGILGAALAVNAPKLIPEILATFRPKKESKDKYDYPENPDDLELQDGWHETEAKDKTGGRHRIWEGPNDEVIRWDKEGRRGSQKERGSHYHDSRFPGKHIKPGTNKKDLEKNTEDK
jgi:RHS repeat-associated protein